MQTGISEQNSTVLEGLPVCLLAIEAASSSEAVLSTGGLEFQINFEHKVEVEWKLTSFSLDPSPLYLLHSTTEVTQVNPQVLRSH